MLVGGVVGAVRSMSHRRRAAALLAPVALVKQRSRVLLLRMSLHVGQPRARRCQLLTKLLDAGHVWLDV